jgi:hypothetical protein
VISSLADSDSEEFRSWSNSLPAGALRDRASLQLALDAARGGDLQSLEISYRSLAGSDAKGVLAAKVAQALAAHDGAAAAEWAVRQPPGPARDAAVRKVAEEWSASAPAAAAQWIEQLPPGADRDACLEEYAAKAVYADPRAAVEWVAMIADHKAQQSAAEKIFWVWNSEDPVAARRWLKELGGAEDGWKVRFSTNSP